ncbi:MAG: AAA family ATPase [Coprococcus sp.]|nr:AAA family ATPase [Coprococcus sp.]
MPRNIGIGHQDFEQIVTNNLFYVDKTNFIKEWWENNDAVTLITRPRRFGKTLNLSMTERFFSVKYAGRSDLFENRLIWKDESLIKNPFRVHAALLSGYSALPAIFSSRSLQIRDTRNGYPAV